MARMVLKSNVRKLIREVGEGFEELRDEWLKETEDAAKARLTQRESQAGYALNSLYDNIKGETVGEKGARVVSDWPGGGAPVPRFFEYGFYNVPPFAYMRAGKRKGDRAFREGAKRTLQRRAERADLGL